VRLIVEYIARHLFYMAMLKPLGIEKGKEFTHQAQSGRAGETWPRAEDTPARRRRSGASTASGASM